MKQKIVFVLSSLNDPHFQKRVKEFIKHDYSVEVYGFAREGRGLPSLDYGYSILGTIRERNYLSRFLLYLKSMRRIAKENRNSVFFFSSLDVALFARLFIRGNYIYEVCDLTELVIRNKWIRCFLIKSNINTIKKSLITILTSPGFANFFRDIDGSKYMIIHNRVSPECPPPLPRVPSENGKIRIGFVGVIRFETTFHFINACRQLNSFEIHLYGIFSEGDQWSKRIQSLSNEYDNIKYHGRFSNPSDLPSIYSSIDLLLCAYTPSPGVDYAEPNKLFESIYFKCPIIVSKGTYLAEVVEQKGIGYSIDAMTEDSAMSFLRDFDYDSYKAILKQSESIPLHDCIDKYDSFFERLADLI